MNTRLLRLCVVVSCLFVFAQCNDSVTQSSNELTDTDNPDPYSISAEGDSTDISQESLSSLLIPEDEGDQVALSPTFDWVSMEGAESYILHVSRGDEMIIEEEVEDSQFTPSEELSHGGTYYWRVRSSNDTDSWTDIQSFTTLTEAEAEKQLEAPTLVYPKAKASGVSLKPEFQWEALSKADSYIIHVSHGDEMIIEEKVNKAKFNLTTKLPENETYYWRVRGINQAVKGEWSEISSFATGTSEDSESSGDTGGTSTGGTGDTGDTGDSDSEETSGDETTVSDGDVRAALMDLYNSTGGDQWSNNSGWGDGEPSDSWHGIDVNSQGQITRIDLFNNGLSGELPKSIGNLKNVTYLNLKGNDLTGSIPPEIGNMSSLEILILQGRNYEIGGTLKEPPLDNMDEWSYHQGKHLSNTNDFSGQIPSTIGNLSNLVILEISNAPNITGPLPEEIGKLSNLQGLYMAWNDFAGETLPSSWGNLSSIKHIYLPSTGVSGSIPSSWSNLTTLVDLNIAGLDTGHDSDTELTGSIPDFSNFTNLRMLVLTKNGLTGDFPKYFNNGNFTRMHTLNFSWNNITGSLPSDFSNMSSLKSLTLSGNNITGSITAFTTVPSNIRIISAGWNDFSSDFPSGWPDFSQIKTLYLNDNDLTGSIPCSFWDKLDNPKLNIAWTKNNDFTDKCVSGMESVDGN